MQIPILAGVYTDGSPAVRVAYPVNMVPVPGQDGIADGYLRPAEGIAPFTTGQGADRGAIVIPVGSAGSAGGAHYRVSGTKLISITAAGVVTVIGDVGGTGPVRLDFSFDRLGILSGGLLYYWNGSALTHVTDVNMPANLIDMVWVDGYWVVTDGTNIVVTNLADPTTVNPLKYGNTDRPDPIQGLRKVQNELTVLSRNFIDVFQNVGGALFPFQIVLTAVITKGVIGTFAASVLNDAVAFIGGGRDEALSVYQGRNAQVARIATIEIDRLLASYTDAQLAAAVVETVIDVGAEFLFVHLPDRTAVYDAIASAAAQQPVWHIRTSAIADFSQYLGRNIVKANGVRVVGHPTTSAIGTWSATSSQHFGSDVRWEFATPMLRNAGKGAQINQLELVALTGAVPVGKDPRVSTSYTIDGKTYSMDVAIRSGQTGDTTRRLIWLAQGIWRNYRLQRFRGDSSSRLAALRLEADIKPLAY